MSFRPTLYAISATAVSGILYFVAKSKLTALRDAGEGSAEEIKRAVSATNISFRLLAVMVIVTVILFCCFIVLRQRDA